MKAILALSLLLSANLLFAKTFIISDIDDTLKVSHVLNTADAALNAFRTDIPFKGSPELFRFLEKEVKDSKFFYVTNAPKWLMKKSHTKFIRENAFPKGDIYLKSEYSSEEHKIKTILKILKKETPTQLILIGDNGQEDIKFYDHIAREVERTYPKMKVHQFIHVLYEEEDTLMLEEGQVPFVTTLGILSGMASQKVMGLSSIKLRAFANSQAAMVLKEQRSYESLMFPEWYACRGYVYSNHFSSRGMVQKAFDHIEDICKQ